MSNVQKHSFTKNEIDSIMAFTREALETYAKEGQKMDVGSVSDLLNMRAGILMQIESSTGFKQVRGNASAYDGRRIGEAVIDCAVYAGSSRSVGSEIKSQELRSVIIKLTIIESVRIEDNPAENMDMKDDVPIVMSADDTEDSWLYPTLAREQDWSAEEYLSRTCKKSDLPPDAWKDNQVIIARTQSYIEEEPYGDIVRD